MSERRDVVTPPSVARTASPVPASLDEVSLVHLLAAIPDVVALKDREQRYLFVNVACATVMGQVPDAVIGRTDEELYPPAVAAALRAVDQRVIATGETVTVTEWVPSAPEGGALRAWCSVKAPLRDATGEIVGVVVMAREETARQLRERHDRVLLALDDAIRPLGDPDAITAAATELLGRALDAGRTSYTEIDEAAGVLHVRQNFTQDGTSDALGTFPLEAFAALVASYRAGDPVVIADTHADPRTAPIVARPEIEAIEPCATLAVPLVKDGALVGVLSVNHPTPRRWTDDEVSLVRAVAERTWAVVERARAERLLTERAAERERLLAGERRARDRAERLQALTAALATSHTPTEVGRAILEQAIRIAQVVAGGVLTVPPASATGEPPSLVLEAVVGYGEAVQERYARIPLDTPVPVCRAAAQRRPVYLASVDEFAVQGFVPPEQDRRGEVGRAWASLPMTVGDAEAGERVLGVLALTFDDPSLVADDARPFLELFAAQCAQAFERARLFDAERVTRIAAETQARRSVALQSLAVALSAADTPEAVARLALQAGREVSGITRGTLYLVDDADAGDASLVNVGAMGYDMDLVAAWGRVPITTGTLAGDAAVRGEPVILGRRDEIARRYPILAPLLDTSDYAGGAVFPLLVPRARDGRDDAVPPGTAPRRAAGIIGFDFDVERDLDAADTQYLAALADLAGQAVARVQSARAAADSLALLDGVFADAPVGLAFFDRQLRYLRINAELAQMNGLAIDAHLGKRLEEILPELADAVNPLFERVLATGTPIRDIAIIDALPRELGGPRHWRASYFPVRAGGRADAEIIAVGVAAEDVTAQVRAEEDREFLLAFGALVQQAPDVETLLATAPGTLAAHLESHAQDASRAHTGAIRCVLTTTDSAMRRLTVRHVADVAPYTGDATPDDIASRASWDDPLAVGRVLDERPAHLLEEQRSGRTVVVDDTRTDARTATVSATHYESIGVRSFVAVPLVRAGTLVGSLTVIDTAPRHWTPREVALIRAAAERLWPAEERLRALATERAAREAAALEERRLAAVLAALPVGVIVVDAPDGKVRYVNDAVRAIWGQAPASRAVEDYSVEWIGYHVDAAGRATDRPYASTEWPIARALLTGTTVQDEPIEAERPDGERRRVVASAAPIRDAAGVVVGGVVTIADVSDAARAREALEAARAAAEQANRAKSEFLANMSHELRTPLNAIQGHVQLIDLELHGPVTSAQRAALGRVQRAQQHLLGLINDVLNYAKLDAGKVEFDLRAIAVRDVVRDVLPMIEPQLVAKGLALDVDLPPEHDEHDVVIRADREKLGQVLLNLLANAVKFTPAVQGAAAPVPGAPGRITIDVVASHASPAQVAVRVRDTGIGIPPEKHASIFDPFVQVSAGVGRTSDGTGLGLAISRDLTRGMGGEITVESIPGVGSTFVVTLLRAEAHDARR